MRINLSEKLKPNKTVVVVLAMQNDLCHKEGFFAKDLGWNPMFIQEMAPVLKKFIIFLRKQGYKIFFSRMINDERSPKNLQDILQAKAERGVEMDWPYTLKKNTWGSELYFSMQPSKDDIVLEQRSFDLFTDGQFQKYLKKFNIENLIVTGVYTEVNVFATATRGFAEGYNIIIPRDLTTSAVHRQEDGELVLEILWKYYAEVIDSRDILRKIKKL